MKGFIFLSGVALACMAVSCGTGTDTVPSDLLSRNGETSRYIVMLDSPQGASTVMRSLAMSRGFSASEFSSSELMQAFRVRNYEYLDQMAIELSIDDIRRIASVAGVRGIHPVQRMRVFAEQLDPPSWGLDRLDQKALPMDKKFIYGDRSGLGVRAFIIDTGIDPKHPEFTNRVLAGFSSIEDGKGTFDCEGHGTHVAGTTAGSSFGIAKRAQLVPVRVLGCDGSGTDEGVVAGMNWVIEQKRAHPAIPMVANMSLGGDPSAPTDDAVRRMTAAGIFLAVAAGNDAEDACGVSPARAPEAVTVGATDNTDDQAYFSNFGNCVDIYAPGSVIKSAKAGGGERFLSGTSMASPHVTGVAAVILSNDPTATPAQVEARMKSDAVRGVVIGVDAGHASNLLLQVDKRNLPLPVPTPTPTPKPTAQPTPTPSPLPGNARLYEGQLGQYGVSTVYVRQSELPIQGRFRVEARLSGPSQTNFDLDVRYWDKLKGTWMEGPASRRPGSDEQVVWTGDATSMEWTVRNSGRKEGGFRLVLSYFKL